MQNAIDKWKENKDRIMEEYKAAKEALDQERNIYDSQAEKDKPNEPE